MNFDLKLSRVCVPGLLLLSMGVLPAQVAPAVIDKPAAVTVPAHGPATKLFDGNDLSHFDTFLRGRGLNVDPERVFRVEDKVIHVSGHEMGYIITKQAFHRFYLRAEFKWGEGTFGGRAGQARDSGILYNIQGEDKYGRGRSSSRSRRARPAIYG